MTENKFIQYTNHIWKMREYLCQIYIFDYPWYGGLKSKFTGSSEACDAMQNIWHDFIRGEFKRKSQFQRAYRNELRRLGELVK